MVYLESRINENVLDDVREFNSVCIVGCPQCANFSFSLKNDLPCYKISIGGIKAESTKDRINNLKKLLGEKGKDVTFWLPNFPFGICSLNAIKRKQLFAACQDADAIISLTCEGGKKNIENILGSTPVVEGMNAKGLIVSTTRVNLWRREISIDKENIYIQRFVFES